MNPIRKENVLREPLEADAERQREQERTDRLLLEISDDARRLKDRYLDDTVVPEGGE